MKKTVVILSIALIVGHFANATSLFADSSSSSNSASNQAVVEQTFEPGEVTQDEIQQIIVVFSELLTSQKNRATVLTNFKLMLANQPEMGIRRLVVEEAVSKLTEPQRALFNVTAGFFKLDLQVRLKSTFDDMLSAFPEQSALLDSALDIGVKMAIAPKFLDLFDAIAAISPNYIGIQVERAQEDLASGE